MQRGCFYVQFPNSLCLDIIAQSTINVNYCPMKFSKVSNNLTRTELKWKKKKNQQNLDSRRKPSPFFICFLSLWFFHTLSSNPISSRLLKSVVENNVDAYNKSEIVRRLWKNQRTFTSSHLPAPLVPKDITIFLMFGCYSEYLFYFSQWCWTWMAGQCAEKWRIILFGIEWGWRRKPPSWDSYCEPCQVQWKWDYNWRGWLQRRKKVWT